MTTANGRSFITRIVRALLDPPQDACTKDMNPTQLDASPFAIALFFEMGLTSGSCFSANFKDRRFGNAPESKKAYVSKP